MAFIIDDHIRVKFGDDAELVFKHPGKRAVVALQGLTVDEKGEAVPEEEQARRLWDMLVEVKGMQRMDGTPVTKESLVAGEWNDLFLRETLARYVQALAKRANPLDEKNG